MSHKDDQLRRMLAEDADTDDIDALHPALSHLRRPDLTTVTTADTHALIEHLAPELPQAKSSWRESWILLLLWNQTKIIQSEIWIASLLVMALGTIVTLVSFDPTSGALTPLAIAAPVISAIGIGLLYDSDSALIRDLENSTQASVQVLLLARLTLVFGFDLALALGGSVLLATLTSDLSFMPLVMSWLAPMTFLSALAFFLSVVSVNAVIGGVVSLVLWTLHVFMQTVDGDTLIVQVLSLEGLAVASSRPFLFICAVLLILLALWISGFDENLQGDWS